ncbi:hypothetical protein [Mycolicibacterium hodleri]|uniref:Transposase n=1 Tax=Mycolicibacterium hodleri TaxID=49897 RepID=A0A502E7J5_9MYCO|nr:hypothetical protein [Mycolicibacterium hodleri]TPG32466.1 hypothetical protein EAH80_19540 [Mycolicibacterium hodleri]
MVDSGRLGESDWEDEDLLTHEEAGERLRDEIAAEIAFIDGAAGADSPGLRRSKKRLEVMRRRLQRIDDALAGGVGKIRRLESPPSAPNHPYLN